jgi:hypothetical protein
MQMVVRTGFLADGLLLQVANTAVLPDGESEKSYG